MKSARLLKDFDSTCLRAVLSIYGQTYTTRDTLRLSNNLTLVD